MDVWIIGLLVEIEMSEHIHQFQIGQRVMFNPSTTQWMRKLRDAIGTVVGHFWYGAVEVQWDDHRIDAKKVHEKYLIPI